MMRPLRHGFTALCVLLVLCTIQTAAQETKPADIWMAAARGDIDRLAALLTANESVNARDVDGNSPLHHAAWNSQFKAMQLLLDHGADINSQSDQLWTPLHWAARNGQEQSVQWLLNHGAKVDIPAHLDQTALHLAAKHNYRVTLKRLLEAGADPNAKDTHGQTPVHLAALEGYTTIMIDVLHQGGDIEAKTAWGATPLSAAAARGRTSTVAALLIRKAEVNAKTDAGWTPLFSAIVGKYDGPALFLRNSGADLNILTKAHSTLMHAAASSGMDEWIVALLDAGLDVNAQDGGGRSPLDHARENLWSETADLLLSNGAKPGPKPTLHHAALSGDLAKVRRLVAAGADLAKRDGWHLPPRNWTPLHYAAAGGDVAVVDTLIRAGADPRAIDYSGWTPMVAALAKRHVAAANILKSWESLPGIVRVKHDGQMTFQVLGITGTQCDIEASQDLKQWNRIGQVTLENGRAHFRDIRRIQLPICFYRAKVVE
ncbi:MAG: ankyrin repeat domain-containing protein [Verrucomicrobiota bacterium]|jgi:ankyrin repeat protein|nr:ankyrin repeat domain-containing protein [Verrucomicrobiota bacterium]